jgi:hypothetical protein
MSAVDYLRVLADFNRNGAFNHALSDISGRVLSASFSYGFDAPDQRVAPPATGTVVLDNSDGAFLPGQPGALYAGLLQRDVLIEFKHTAAYESASLGVTLDGVPLLLLRVIDIQIEAGQFGGRVVVLTLGDWHAELMSVIYDPPLTTNTSTGYAIVMPFDAGLLPLPYAGSYWVLGASVLDTDTTLFSALGNISTYPGQTTLDYVGDNIDRGQGVSLYSFIEEMCAAEMDGRFWLSFFTYPGYTDRPRYQYIARDSLAYYYNSSLKSTFTADTFNDTGNEYEYGRTLCNKLEVTMYPRTLGSVGTELARTASPMLIPGVGIPGNKSTDNNNTGNTRTFTLRYRDPDNPEGTCAATTIIQPVASTDYTGNLAADGSGEDYTSNLVVSVVNKTNAVEVTVSNTALGPVYLTLFKIRGTPLTARQPLTVTSADAQSIYDYGLNRQSRTIAGVDDVELVQAYADTYVQTHKDPIARFRRVSFDFPPEPSGDLYKQSLFGVCRASAVRILDPWTEDATNARLQWIAGTQHVIDGNARTWRTTWFLDDYLTQAPWLLGDDDLSVLDVSTRPTF